MKLIFLLMFLSFAFMGRAQKSMDDFLAQTNTQSVPYISVEALKMDLQNYLILDTRKREEYEVSHINNAIWVSEWPDKRQLESLKIKPSQPIVVYCSVGVRSEDFGEKLVDMGFTNVHNLYGSIFAWKDAGYTVVDKNGKETQRIHIFAKRWGVYLKSGEQVY